MAATAALLVLCGAGYVALTPENPETAEPEAAIAVTEAFLGATLAADPTRTRVILIREDRPLVRVMMVLPDAAYARLAQDLNDAHRHDPRREVQGLPGPDAAQEAVTAEPSEAPRTADSAVPEIPAEAPPAPVQPQTTPPAQTAEDGAAETTGPDQPVETREPELAETAGSDTTRRKRRGWWSIGR